MSGEDKKKPEPEKPTFETADFSASLNSNQPGPNDVTIKAEGTMVADFGKTTPAGAVDSSASTHSEPAGLPADIPGFVVKEELGRGAFGVVFAARDEMLDRMVAIKKPLISDPMHRQQYIDEARKAVKLEHPGIVPIYHVGITATGEPFVVQKLIEGSSLRGLLKSNDGRLPIAQIVSIMRQVCLAVDAAHSAGVVHRDLKPENLLVEPDGRVYVADFGLAIVEDDEQVRKGREVAGTPFYMSPEQFSGRNEWLDGRSDIWAIGVIFYELLSGKTPFYGRSMSELKDEIRNKDPRPIHQRDPNIPAAFDGLFRKCCAKQVSDRFASVHELVSELDAICKTLVIDVAEWEARARVGTGSSQHVKTGSLFDTRRDTVAGRGQSTHRGMSTTMRASGLSSVLRESSMLWSLLGPVLTTVLTLGAIVGGAWYMKLGPFAIVPQASPTIPVPPNPFPLPSTQEVPKSSEPVIETKPVVPEKPFIVSIKGDGTHLSIAEAISDSAAGETITIREGSYRESLIIDRSLTLVGLGKVRMIATDKACMEIRADSQVAVENINFECQTDERNTIDIFSGKLSLKDCEVFASSPHSYDCVRVRSNSILVAEHSHFQSMEHAAIYGDPDAVIAIQDSTISFPGNQDYGPKRCGIQATGAKGLIRNCTIVGPCVAGIDWMESPSQELAIESCRLDKCDNGILLRECGAVKIQGTSEQRCEIKNARFGINVVASKADIKQTQVNSSGENDKVGLQITKDSQVDLADCHFEGMQCGILIHQSTLLAGKLSVQDTRFAGMLVDEASVDADEIRLQKIGDFGLAVLSTNKDFQVKLLVVEATPVTGQRLTSGIYAASGSIQFDQATFLDCLCGICVDPEREIIEYVGFPKKTLADLLKSTRRSDQPLPKISGEQLAIASSDFVWTFAGTGTSVIRQIVGDLPDDRRIPRLVYPDKLELNGSDYSNFSVISKSARK